MVLLFTDGKHKHFKQLEGKHCVVNFDLDGRLYFRALRSENYIILSVELECNKGITQSLYEFTRKGE